jgi:uncharacterized protein YutE (UPF0331/DUF86 family)
MDAEAKSSVIRRVEFARSELSDLRAYLTLDFETYNSDRVLRRNVERIIENAANSVCDIGKIVLSQHDTPMPESYRDVFLKLGELRFISPDLAESLALVTRLRNVLAHQYLDIKWDYIRRFMDHDVESIYALLKAAEAWAVPCMGP